MMGALDNLFKGLILHFLRKGTVQEAVEQGRNANMPKGLLDVIPALMSDVTSAAEAVFKGERELKDMLDQLSEIPTATKTERQAARKNFEQLIQTALGFMKELSGGQGIEIQLPVMDSLWYEYGRTEKS